MNFDRRQIFLLAAAIGLIPIALSYGAAPQHFMDKLFGIQVEDTNQVHIFRAIMGLYLALVLFWIYGAFNSDLTHAALYSLVIFMLGLAGGRVVSLLADGWPHWLLVVYLVLEVAFGVVGIILIRSYLKK
ncbi:MAG: DUF4345 domain-containing protein [Hyphomicrobiales bacterium]